MQLHCETTGDLVQALVHVRCSDVVIEGAGANGQSVSPKGGGPCNMKKTIQTKGRYTDSQGCKETCRSAFQSYLFQHQRLNEYKCYENFRIFVISPNYLNFSSGGELGTFFFNLVDVLL
ncbi:uncharacterized protein [Triticum aestivum]|uniref:uncharacterized protein isoform X2 n=1 Tax=Triticum aestivum TaxID=4565 RepID=UPI001D011FED|nr:uncharacterized protein LOC123180834 isoform X2 [Triticum aestivum]